MGGYIVCEIMIYCQYSSVHNIQKDIKKLLVDTALCMDKVKGGNHKMKRKLLAVLMAVCMATTFVGGSTVVWAAQEESTGKEEVIVTMPTTSEPEAGFDPAYGWGAGEHVHEPLIQSTLTVTNTDLSIGMDLATDYSVSEDGLTWTVKIRDDVKFTDGEPLTAEDVAYFLINVVFPEPRKPVIKSIFTILCLSFVVINPIAIMRIRLSSSLPTYYFFLIKVLP